MRFDNKNPEEHEKAALAAGQCHTLVQKMTYAVLQGLQQGGDNDPPDHVYVALMAAAGAVEIAAKIMSSPDNLSVEEFMKWAEGPVSRTAVLAASLLLARCFLPEDDGCTFEFNPINIRAAIDAMSKVTGSRDTSMLTTKMVEAADAYTSPDHFFDNTRIKPADTRTLN
jgi:hypothetical protein